MRRDERREFDYTSAGWARFVARQHERRGDIGGAQCWRDTSWRLWDRQGRSSTLLVAPDGESYALCPREVADAAISSHFERSVVMVDETGGTANV